MFGIGKTSKAVVRKVKHYLEDNFRNSAESATFYRQLSKQYYDPGYFIDIVPQYKIVFVQVPKAGSSTIKTLLAKAAGTTIKKPADINYRKRSGLLSPRDYGLDNFCKLLDDPDAMIFTVVRHPYQRLLSCYQDKFANDNVGKKTPYNLDAKKIISPKEWEILDPNRPLPIENFVQMACKSAYSRINGHWSAISDIVPLTMMPFTHVGKTEAIGKTIDLLRARGLPEEAFGELQLNKTGGGTRKDSPLTDAQKSKINSAYTKDFTNFGYQPF